MKNAIFANAIFLAAVFVLFNFIGFLYWLMDHGYNVVLAIIIGGLVVFGVHALFEIERGMK